MYTIKRQTLLSAAKSALKAANIDDPLLGESLTNMEIRILHLILDGHTNDEIADFLHRSVRTVEVHRSGIMHKLGVTNVVELVKRAVMLGLVELPGRR